MTQSPIHHPVSINMDAIWLRDFVRAVTDRVYTDSGALVQPEIEDEQLLRLLSIADNIDRLDHANSQAYALGVNEGEARVYARSNIAPDSVSITKRQGLSLLDALNRHTGGVTKVPQGVRALDDKPQDFNAPRRKPVATAKPRPTLAIDLDLSDI